MKTITKIGFMLCLFAMAPLSVFAHAAPVEQAPVPSEQLVTAPSEIRIRFSERVEPGASRITVKDEKGAILNEGKAEIDPSNPHILSISLKKAELGTFFVTWSVVSSDDGHFTKGSYAYFVGEQTTAAPSIQDTQVVQISALPEAITIFIELLGHSLLWGSLVLFAFGIRRLIGRFDQKQKTIVYRTFLVLVVVGIVLVISGEVAHILIKTKELASLHSIARSEAVSMYFGTTSGFATLFRAGAGIVFALIFFFRRKSIFSSSKITMSEVFLFIALLVFAFMRAKVSHAAANPFFPQVSILINLVHLIGKDLWVGIIGILSLTYLSKSLRSALPQINSAASSLLAIAVGIVGVTAPYIIWLHLKAPANVSSSLWGERFVPLFVAASLLIALRCFHVFAGKWRENVFNRFSAYSLPAEFAVGILVVFFSSLMIITSPPIERIHGKVFEATSNGANIRLEKAPFEDGVALLTIETKSELSDRPIITLEGEGGLVIDLDKRFENGFVFPLSTITPGETHRMEVVATQKDSYDARATFSVSRSDLDPQDDSQRSFDSFTLIMIFLSFGAIILSFVLFRFPQTENVELQRKNRGFSYSVGILIGLFIASQAIGLGNKVFANDFKKQCLADLNTWHLMTPTRNGRVVSEVSSEGCMALNGSFFISDVREYEYLRAPGKAEIVFKTDLKSINAGIPTMIEFSIKDGEGKPAILSVQHERIVHFIVISEDMKEFRHIHPEDYEVNKGSDKSATFKIPFTFPRGGKYVIAMDYAHGLTPESRHFEADVSGGISQGEVAKYPLKGVYGESGEYQVELDPSIMLSGEPASLAFRVKKNGKNVYDMTPYLGAAMHVAVIKNDLSEFTHAHGEVHLQGVPVPPVNKNGIHQHAPPPPRFGPVVDVHPIFKGAGLYTLFAQFLHEGKVVTTHFTVRVD